MLAQRQAVHGAWDLPREDTMQRFFQTHPQWQHTAPLQQVFTGSGTTPSSRWG